MSLGLVEDRLVFEKSRAGRRGVTLPASDAGEAPLESLLPGGALRNAPPALPELSELEVVRHYTRLSGKNFGIDTTFYPLGSCTMKYNPRVHEYGASLPGFARVHPLQPDETVQGFLALAHSLERALAEITGLAAATLNPSAGAHGELTGVLMVRAYHHDRSEPGRDTVLIPDSAHGTNPATVTIAGMQVQSVKSGPDGRVDLGDLREKLGTLGGRVAAMMITNPSTLGLFEIRIGEIARLLHEKGALLYMDGANMNALLGIARPGDFGVDVMHLNLHKTFTQPHGGGGPGAGPVAVGEKLVPFLPVPRIVQEGGAYRRREDFPKTIGRVRSFQGNPGVFVRAYAYIRSHGGEGLRKVTEAAVLNANYILARLRDAYDLAYPGPCMHEAVFSARRQVKQNGVRALDIAKRLIDLGFHPPTIYFPLIVPESLMIEPTETEPKETLDAFVAAMLTIAGEAAEEPQKVKDAPVTMPVTRLDEVRAVKQPRLRWRPR
ncbi:MAG: aminomethyl-transferring glycine dehydrogenase subunit GcvPB [Planctomycetales bacterium]|nr:aminomethyl-transferring glycine dehydrogenase subunit GcvPB [Planctomycetales bacterium]